MSIKLTYTTINGKVEDVYFERDVETITVHPMRIQNIDLSPLSSCTKLKALNLENHALQGIDLLPLSSCRRLQRLNLASNRLQSIDLSPLNSCPKITDVNLAGNQIQSIDLSPLSSCSELRNLFVGSDQLQGIDLSPISSCGHLEWLSLGGDQLQSIDLSPISSNTELQYLTLTGTQLQGIDLSPISLCTRLKNLRLGNNQFHTIDLSPIKSCTELGWLSLSSNQLGNIDLSPIKSCTRLKNLDLGNNQFKSIDLSPLRSCVHLEALRLYRNQLDSIDISPLSSCTYPVLLLDLSGNPLQTKKGSSWLLPTSRSLRQSIYAPPTQSFQWSFLRDVVEYHDADVWFDEQAFQTDSSGRLLDYYLFRVHYDILRALGLGDYGFIDCNLTDILLSISPDATTEEARNTLSDVLKEEIVATIENRGQTTGLNLDGLAMKHSEIAVKAKDVIRLRAHEIEQTVIKVDDDEIDLSTLWLTAYGHEMLSALELCLTTDSKNFGRVKRAFADIGYELNLGESSVCGVDMTDVLKNCIWWIAENKGKPWNEIEEDL